MAEENTAATVPPAKRQRAGEEDGDFNDAAPAEGRLRTAQEICEWMQSESIPIPTTIHSPWNGTIAGGRFQISAFTDIGGRRSQEDRFVVCPRLAPSRDDCALFGVYDGTVGDFASDTVKGLVMPHLVGSPHWKSALELLPSAGSDGKDENHPVVKPLLKCMRDLHVNADLELVDMCARNHHHYAAATSATCLIAGPYCVVGHLGDSRVALGYVDEAGNLKSKFLTTDHKPDQLHERQRIMDNGGSVEYLVNHNRKPFIRGGDFTIRKSRGEQPMQLQYSRAFGGKDLKMFGLSREPDVNVIPLNATSKCLIVASDGLWDVRSSDEAVRIAIEACRKGRDPSEALVDQTVKEMQLRRQAADNITAIVIFLHL